ncbi:Na+/H+ antiporter NhaC family protein [Ammoniphilus sp. CFH 90114]|uniref:Na+/H+ antiporter NhaC family protein n=1 Tax=Ammoniphilus sp. CFH 90114 TaxID=2493665 RepID=UPI00100E2EBA|nr:Na+/H+ antiporter NhaC family protein [Ammoniphilus sp. CFH 90114]RXT00373.1 hypothetical protein EIZ39_25940 [Ammoniphilus sp. CFH 90114]
MTNKSMRDASLSVIYIVGGVGLAGILQIPLFIGFFVAVCLMILLLLKRGMSTKEIWEASLAGMKRTRPVIFILLLTALLIPVWISSGTIPIMIQIGVQWINPEWIVLVAFLLAATVSFLLGTSIGTLGSLGVVIISVAISANVSVPLVAGALISGAFVAERMSPLSSLFHLVANSVDTHPTQLFRKMVPSSLLLVGIGICFYTVLGMNASPVIPKTDSLYQTLLASHFHSSFISFAPLIVLFGSIFLRNSTLKSLGFGVATGILVALFYEQVHILALLQSMVFGYTSSHDTLALILRGGGLLRMYELILFICLAGIMNGLLDRTQLFQPLIDQLFRGGMTITNYTARTVMVTLLLALIGSNQAFPALVAGRSLSGTWGKEGFGREDLGRVISDTAIVTSGIIPWNMVAILSTAALGVPTLAYAPYALLLWISPITTIIISYWLSKTSSFSNQDAHISSR